MSLVDAIEIGLLPFLVVRHRQAARRGRGVPGGLVGGRTAAQRTADAPTPGCTARAPRPGASTARRRSCSAPARARSCSRSRIRSSPRASTSTPTSAPTRGRASRARSAATSGSCTGRGRRPGRRSARLNRLHRSSAGPVRDPRRRPRVRGAVPGARPGRCSLWVHATLVDSTLATATAGCEPTARRRRARLLRGDAGRRPGCSACPTTCCRADVDAFDDYVAVDARARRSGAPVGDRRATLAASILHPPLAPASPSGAGRGAARARGARRWPRSCGPSRTPAVDWLLVPVDRAAARARRARSTGSPGARASGAIDAWLTARGGFWRPPLPPALRWFPQALAADRRVARAASRSAPRPERRARLRSRPLADRPADGSGPAARSPGPAPAPYHSTPCQRVELPADRLELADPLEPERLVQAGRAPGSAAVIPATTRWNPWSRRTASSAGHRDPARARAPRTPGRRTRSSRPSSRRPPARGGACRRRRRARRRRPRPPPTACAPIVRAIRAAISSAVGGSSSNEIDVSVDVRRRRSRRRRRRRRASARRTIGPASLVTRASVEAREPRPPARARG